MLHTGRDATDGQLQAQCYTGRDAATDVTLKTDYNRRKATATDSVLTVHDATLHGTLKTDYNRRTATTTVSTLQRA